MFHRVATSPACTAVAKRAMSSVISGIAVGGPPANRVPFATKVGLGIIMCGGACVYPFWVLTHLPAYKGQAE